MLAAILFLCGTINVWAQSANNIPADIDAADATIIEKGNIKGTSHLGDVNGDGTISVSDVMALVDIILNGENSIDNIVVNGADGITYGGGSGPAHAGENHIWE